MTEGYVPKNMTRLSKEKQSLCLGGTFREASGSKTVLKFFLAGEVFGVRLTQQDALGPCSPNGPMSSSGLGELYPILLALLLKLQDPFLEVKGILAIAETV